MSGKIKLNAASGGGSVSLQAPSSSSNNRVITLPDIDDFVLNNKPAFRARLTTETNHSGGTSLVPLNTKDFDFGGCFNATSSLATLNGISVPAYSFLPNVAGTYCFSYTATSNSTNSGTITSMSARLYKNTTVISSFYSDPKDTDPEHILSGSGTTIISMNGTSDYVQLKMQMAASAGTIRHLANDGSNVLCGFKLIL